MGTVQVSASGTLHPEEALKPSKADIIAHRMAPGLVAEVVEFAEEIVGFFGGLLLPSRVDRLLEIDEGLFLYDFCWCLCRFASSVGT